jgi:pseudaminic acid cytidylyltransferase
MRKLAIIPARGGSKRIERKNIKKFLGRPIISYSIRTAIRSKLFDEVMVSTDDEEIADIAQFYGATVPFLRSPETSSDYATTVDVLLEVLGNYQKQGINFNQACCIYPTAPMISTFQLNQAYQKLIRQNFDSVIPVTEFTYSIYRALALEEGGRQKMINAQNEQIRSQDLPKAYHDAGQFYWFDVNKLQEVKTLFSKNTGSIILDPLEVQDIDTETDWKLAEMKYKLLNNFYENQDIFSGKCA